MILQNVCQCFFIPLYLKTWIHTHHTKKKNKIWFYNLGVKDKRTINLLYRPTLFILRLKNNPPDKILNPFFCLWIIIVIFWRKKGRKSKKKKKKQRKKIREHMPCALHLQPLIYLKSVLLKSKISRFVFVFSGFHMSLPVPDLQQSGTGIFFYFLPSLNEVKVKIYF